MRDRRYATSAGVVALVWLLGILPSVVGLWVLGIAKSIARSGFEHEVAWNIPQGLQPDVLPGTRFNLFASSIAWWVGIESFWACLIGLPLAALLLWLRSSRHHAPLGSTRQPRPGESAT
ncbi:hypothetical protein N1028_18680 [Herbiconiux sp. CPCC 203407]|uniref:Uncharacterized protein n=1 Tax=Herbiconiux oxytropis TaxID=2970915 RepID=A0AA42BX19_9MICO|nr:hypothetical protein [Herbiconiux oxytropis]MCS5723425.1 hypothetical protein [Herbiconiux oxytropis]MCS5727928.1 hypothetical protein [Herbiconiux oxytropis]